MFSTAKQYHIHSTAFASQSSPSPNTIGIVFLSPQLAFSMDSVKYAGCYKAALGALNLKYWGTVVGRVRRVLVPHLLYEPQRYVRA